MRVNQKEWWKKSRRVTLNCMELSTLRSLCYNAYKEKEQNLADVEPVLIPAQKSLIVEIKALYHKLDTWYGKTATIHS